MKTTYEINGIDFDLEKLVSQIMLANANPNDNKRISKALYTISQMKKCLQKTRQSLISKERVTICAIQSFETSE